MADHRATQDVSVRVHPAAVADARRLLRVLCTTAGTAPDTVERAELALSEVVTNALTHGRAPIALSVAVDEGRVTVAVSDAGEAPMRLHAAAPDDRHGRGLAIVAAVATAWGWERPVAGGRLVWFTVGAPTGRSRGLVAGA